MDIPSGTDPESSDGLSSKSLPVTVKAGRATFKADLRLRVQCGAEAEILGIGAGAELGIYANIIEFVAVLDSTPTCALRSTEWWDLNVGAFAHFDVVVDYTTIGAIPTVSTTLLSAPKFTQCWLEIGGSPGESPAETGGYLSQTATTIAVSVSLGSSAISATVTSPAETGYTETMTTITVPTVTTGPALSESDSLSSSSFKFPLTNSSSSTGGDNVSTLTSAGGDDLVTSTVYTTTVYTITSCAANVVNCPASYQQEILVTQTVDVYTTVCPATALVTAPSSISSAAPAAPASSPGQTTTATVHIITDVVVLVPCANPIVESFVPATTIVPPAIHQVTGTVYAVLPSSISASSFSSSSKTASASPFVGGVGKEVQYSNGTATYSPSAYGNAKPSASWSPTGSPAPAKTAVTAGAAGKVAAQGLAVVACGLAAFLPL